MELAENRVLKVENRPPQARAFSEFWAGYSGKYGSFTVKTVNTLNIVVIGTTEMFELKRE